MADSILLNDGSFRLLNDGTSHVLLNAHVGAGGVGISGGHATQQTLKKRIISVEFTFQLIASMLERVELKLQQLGEKLHPHGIYNDKLRDSFREQRKIITKLKQKIKESIIENTANDLLEDVFGDSYEKFKMYMELMKKLGR